MGIKATINTSGTNLSATINKSDTVKVEGVKLGLVTKDNLGLGNVNNTSDANKPVSNATQTALDNITNAGTFNSPTFNNSPRSISDFIIDNGKALRLRSEGTDPKPAYDNIRIAGTDTILKDGLLKIHSRTFDATGEQEQQNNFGFNFRQTGVGHTFTLGDADVGGASGLGTMIQEIKGAQADLNITGGSAGTGTKRARISVDASSGGPGQIVVSGTTNSFIQLKHNGADNFKVNVDDNQSGTTMDVGKLRIKSLYDGSSKHNITLSNTGGGDPTTTFEGDVEFKNGFRSGLDADNASTIKKPLERGIITSDVRVVNSALIFDKRHAARDAFINSAARFSAQKRTDTEFKMQTLNSPSDSPDGSPTTTSTDYEATVTATGVDQHQWSVNDCPVFTVGTTGGGGRGGVTFDASPSFNFSPSFNTNVTFDCPTNFQGTVDVNASPNFNVPVTFDCPAVFKTDVNFTDSNVIGLTSSDVQLGNVTNESKTTMFSNPTFTGNVDLSRIAGANNITIQPDNRSAGGYDVTIQGGRSNNSTGGNVNIQAGTEGSEGTGPGDINIGTDEIDRITIGASQASYTIGNSSAFRTAISLGNVTNESKATMFTSAALTGTPTAPTASAATNNTQIATTAYTTTAINNLIDSAPGTLNTLNEIAAAIGDSPNTGETIDAIINTLTKNESDIAVNTASIAGLGTTSTLDVGISNNNIAQFTTGAADNDFLRIDGTKVEGRSASEVLSDIGGQASLTFGKSSGNALKSEEALTTNDVLLMGSSNVKGRTFSEIKSDLSLGNVTNESKSTMFTSAALTGTPTAPTAGAGTNTTQIATTAFVKTALDNNSPGLESNVTFADLTVTNEAVFDNGLQIKNTSAFGDGLTFVNSPGT